MKCKFCGNDKSLIKAHIIPAGFFRRLPRGREPLEIITNKAGEYKKKAPVGVYDKTIVCRECENIWVEWDDYAQKLLAEEPLNGQALYHCGQKIGYVVKEFEYKKLKLFFISMIWRASVSSHQFFSKVSLGPFEQIAKEFVANNNPGSSEDFGVLLAKFDHPLGKLMLDPHPERFSQVNYYRFYLAGFVAYIKVDHRTSSLPLSKFTINDNGPLFILCRDFKKAKELSLMKQLLTANKSM